MEAPNLLPVLVKLLREKNAGITEEAINKYIIIKPCVAVGVFSGFCFFPANFFSPFIVPLNLYFSTFNPVFPIFPLDSPDM